MKDAEADEQHKSIISALKVAVREWKFEQINFVVGNRGLVVESEVCEAHNQVIVSFLQQVQGGTRTTTEGSR